MGYSGHAFVLLDACKTIDYNIYYYCNHIEMINNPFNLKYLGNETSNDFNWGKVDDFILGIGNNLIRKKVYKLLAHKNKTIHTVIHNNSLISSSSEIGQGTFVSSGANINALSKKGVNCIINTGVIIEHECVIGNHTHIAPGAVLLGNVSIGNNCFIGANAVIKENTTVEDNVTIGAGSVVLKNVSNGQVFVGNPAKKINI